MSEGRGTRLGSTHAGVDARADGCVDIDAPDDGRAGTNAGRDTLLDTEACGDALVAWYRESARDLPWRHTGDPYEVLVSEVMLQQTRVETVRYRYARFLRRFPSLETLASADVDEVLAEWSGLGYYRRARALHALARQVTAHDEAAAAMSPTAPDQTPPASATGTEVRGVMPPVVHQPGAIRPDVRSRGKRPELPRDPAALRRLPGVGPYTAAAVASIAFGVPALALDGNVARVLCRLAAIEDDPRRAAVRRRLEELAVPLLDRHPPGDLNQALMELGARICLPRNPRCDACPCEPWCAARATGLETTIPPSFRQQVRDVVEAAAVIEHDGHYLLLRGQRPGVLQDMWEFPTLDSRLVDDLAAATADMRTALGRYLSKLGLAVDLGKELGTIRHGITDRRITCRIFRATLSRPALPGASDAPDRGWFSLTAAAGLPLATSARRTMTILLQEAPNT